MVAIIDLAFDYPVPTQQLWACVTDYAALAVVNRRYVRLDGLPAGRLRAGQSIDVGARLFGWLPPQSYHIDVLEVDEALMRACSREAGGGVKNWLHNFQVTATLDGSCLVDHIEIDAGWRTPLFKAWAQRLYTARHEARLKLLGVG